MKISSYIFSITLTTLLFLNSTKVTLTYAYYTLDPIGFIEELCENKDKPELQCNGKCHLKKVAQSQDKKQNTPESIIDFKELVLYVHPDHNFELHYYSNQKRPAFFSYLNLYTFKNSKDCFHPPRI